MNTIKLGIIGSNFVSDWLCDSVKISDGIVNHAVYSRTSERGSEFAAKHSIPNVYTDLEEFLSSNIDAVYIASPNFRHFDQAISAITHGKHVLLEKPATLNEKEFMILEQAAKENGVILLEAMRPAHDPAMEIVRELMKKIGTIRRAVFDFCQYSSRYDKFRSGEILNAFNPAYGNAALMDIGVYALHCAVNLFGEPESVYSKSVKLHNGMEGMGTVILSYDSCQVEVVYSKITDSYNPSVITGEDGYVTIGKVSTLETVGFRKRGGEEEILVSDRTENNMIYEIADFVKCIRGEMSADRFGEMTRIGLRVMDEIRRQNDIMFDSEMK